MTNPYRAVLLTLLKVADVMVVTVALAAAICFSLAPGDALAVLEMRVTVGNALVVAGYLLGWHLTMQAFGLYGAQRLAAVSTEWRDLGRAVLAATLPLWVLGLLADFAFATPVFPLVFAGASFVGLLCERRVFRTIARMARREGRNLRNVVIVGTDAEVAEMPGRVARRTDLGYVVIAVVPVGADGDDPVVARLEQLLAEHPIDEVFVTVPFDTGQHLIQRVAQLCEEQGVTVRALSPLVDLVVAHAQLDVLDGRPVIAIFSGPPDSLTLTAKRALDVVGSLVLLVALAPVLALIALAVRLGSRGPVLFAQERVGLGGRRFRMLKFRTMVQDAERLQATLESHNEAQGPVFKIRRDPRITRVGAVLRRLSLDELPQLVNVLTGDMSLVGPRPLPVRDVERIDVRAHKRRCSVRPGLTCLWQVQRREPEFEAWIKTDMDYIDHWSLSLDLAILARTIPAVLSGRGAY